MARTHSTSSTKILQQQVVFNFLSPLVLQPGTARCISERGLIINTLIPVELSDIYSAVSGEPQSFEFCFVSGTACALQKPATGGHTGLLWMWQSEQRLLWKRGMLTNCFIRKKCDFLIGCDRQPSPITPYLGSTEQMYSKIYANVPPHRCPLIPAMPDRGLLMFLEYQES